MLWQISFFPMITVVIPNNNDHDHLRFLRVIVTGKWVSTIAINHSQWAVIAIRWFPSHNQLVHSSSRLVMSIHTGSHNKSRELHCIVRSRLQDDLQWWTGDDPLSSFMTLYITLYPLITTTSRWTDSISWWALSTDREEFVGCVLMFNFSWGARMSTWGGK